MYVFLTKIVISFPKINTSGEKKWYGGKILEKEWTCYKEKYKESKWAQKLEMDLNRKTL